MRWLVAMILFCACRPTRVSEVHGSLEVAPRELDFGAVETGQSSVRELKVANASKVSKSIALSVGAPYTVTPNPLHIGAASDAVVTVTFAPAVVGEVDGSIEVTIDDARVDVPLRGRGAEACPRVDCQTTALDSQTGRCVATAVDDQTSCSNACLVAAFVGRAPVSVQR